MKSEKITMPPLVRRTEDAQLDELRRQRDEACSDRQAALDTANYLAVRVKQLDKEKKNLLRWFRRCVLRSLMVPGVILAVTAVLVAMVSAAVKASLISPQLGEPLAVLLIAAASCCAGIIGERASYLWVPKEVKRNGIQDLS